MTIDQGTPATTLRRVQHDTAVDAVAAGLLEVGRGQLRLARCVSEIAVAIDVVDRLLPSGLVVVLTSSQELVDHVAAQWSRVHPDAAYLLTGSRHGAGDLPNDLLLTTSSDIIATWAAARPGGHRVLVGQHRHADLIGEGLLKAGGWADIVMVHEAHHTAGYTTRRLAVHDDLLLPAAVRLYTTAAPRVFHRPESPPPDPQAVALSMNEEVFGPVLHEYSPEQAITDGTAAHVRLRVTAAPMEPGADLVFCTHRDSRRTIAVTLAEALTVGDTPLPDEGSPCCVDSADAVAITITRPTASKPDVTITIARTSAPETVDQNWVDILQTYRGVRYILRALRDWDPAFGTALDVARARGRRHHGELLRWLTIEPPTATTVDDVLTALINAGTHDWWAGYGHLAAHHARTGDAVVPISYTVNGFPLGEWLVATRAKYVRQGLPPDRYNAMRALGPIVDNQVDVNRQRRWDRHIATAQAFHQRYGHLDIDLPGTDAPTPFRAWISQVRRGYWPVTDVERATLDKLGMQWDPQSLRSRKAIAAAFADYHTRHGNIEFPKELVVDVRGKRVRLFSWVRVFRREHTLNDLHSDVRHILEDVGFVFDPDEVRWQDLVTAARRYHERHGDLAAAPDTFHTATGKCLHTVLREGRTRLRQGTFDVAHADVLTALDPFWGRERRKLRRTPRLPQSPPAPPPPHGLPVARPPVPRPQPLSTADAAWQAGLLAAWRYRNKFGLLLTTKNYRDPDTGLDLMLWLSRQRIEWRNGRLTPEQSAALDALGMVWDPRATARRLGIQNARSYHAQHGHLRVSQRAPFHGKDARGEPYNLYTALAKARRDRVNDVLHPEWQEVLDELGFDFTPGRSLLLAHIAALETYHAEHGDLDIPRGHHAHASIGFVNDASQRSRISEDLQSRLDSVGYRREWRSRDWDDMFTVVEQFYKQCGHMDIPFDLRAVRPRDQQRVLVRTWLNSQRRRMATGQLTAQQKQRLDSIGYIWDIQEVEWMEKYNLAKRFHRQHGHLAVSKRHVHDNNDWAPLPMWIQKQVKLRAAQQLSNERVALLNRIDMPWVERPWRERAWDQRLQQVDEFRRLHGHVRIRTQANRTADPAEATELGKLAAWLSHQSICANRGTLRADRRERLVAIGISLPASDAGPDERSRREPAPSITGKAP